MSDRPLPRTERAAQPYWEAANDERLMVQYCEQCDRHLFPPRVACPYCLTDDPVWAECTGEGTVYTYSVVHEPSIDWFGERAPYPIALIELEEGIFLFANVLDCPPEDVSIGMPVRVTFERVSDEVVLPQFEPV